MLCKQKTSHLTRSCVLGARQSCIALQSLGKKKVSLHTQPHSTVRRVMMNKNGFSRRYSTLESNSTGNGFDAHQFQSLLTTKHIGRYLLYRPEVTSTMDLIQREAMEGAPTGTLVVAGTQTKGRGRVARSWSSPVGNLYCSLLLKPLVPSELPKMNLAAAVSVAKAARSEGIQACVKWPNDVWVGNKKLAGILVDTHIIGPNIHACIGMGVNVNSHVSEFPDPEVTQSATSFYTELNKSVSLASVLAQICNNLEDLLIHPMEHILTEYKKYDTLIGKDIIVMPKKREDPTRVEAHALDITADGFLRVRLKDGTITELVSEEVTIRPT